MACYNECDNKTWQREGDYMNRDEVLRRSVNENSLLDEREQQESIKSFGFGGVIVAILCVFFSIVNAFRGQSFYEFGVIVFALLASTAWKSYISTKKKSFMVQGIICTLGVITNFAGYFIFIQV